MDCDVIVQLTGGPLRSVTIGFLYVCCCVPYRTYCSNTRCPTAFQDNPTPVRRANTPAALQVNRAVRTVVIPLRRAHVVVLLWTLLVPDQYVINV